MGMKCIRCGTDNTLSDRTTNQGRCKNCRHPFAFEPSTVTDYRLKFTDPFFAKAIADISADDTLYFTSKQLFYLLDKRLKYRYSNAFSGVFLYIFFSVWAPGFIGSLLSTVLGQSSFVIVWIGLNLIFIHRFFTATKSSQFGAQYRKTNARNLQLLGGMILIVGFMMSLYFNSFIIFSITIPIGILAIYLGTRQQIRQKGMPETFLFEQNQFQSWVNRWQEINSIQKMLIYPRGEIEQSAVSPDISAYSFDRAVICDSDAIAQLLIANNFHVENNCAVLSITGYPQSILATVMQMLLRNPELKVYAIHDASPRGVSLVHQLRSSPNWFQNTNIKIYDLGLLPRQIFSSDKAFIQALEESAREAKQLPSEVRQSLSKDELVWLESGNFVELESFSPRKIIQVLTQGITRSQDATASESLLLSNEDAYGDRGYIYAVDSFG